MKSVTEPATKAQSIFLEFTLGTLLYAVVLGFFNDYTDVLYVKSFSTVFLASLVLQFLTYQTLGLKRRVAKPFKGKQGFGNKTALIFAVWSVLFFSKFVFLEIIDFIFGSSVEISGFIGLMAIILSVLVVSRIIDVTYSKL